MAKPKTKVRPSCWTIASTGISASTFTAWSSAKSAEESRMALPVERAVSAQRHAAEHQFLREADQQVGGDEYQRHQRDGERAGGEEAANNAAMTAKLGTIQASPRVSSGRKPQSQPPRSRRAMTIA